MPVPNTPGPNVVQYIMVNGVEFRRQYAPDGINAFDQIVDAAIMATPEYATYHASEEAVPVATDDSLYLTDNTSGTDDGQ